MAKQSFQSKLVEFLYKLAGVKKRYDTRQNAIKAANKRIKNQKNYKPFFIYRIALNKLKFMGIDVYKNKIKNFDKVILYIHGGSFIANPNLFQWRMILKIAKKSNSLLIAPIYPKAPFHTYKDTYEILIPLYKEILKTYPNKNISIVGDSAGGCISFVLAQLIKIHNLKPPKDTILLSPCLDLTLKNPEIKNYESKEPSLTINGLTYAYKLWAGNESLTNSMLSPIFGDLNINSNFYLFIGTHEILYPDTLILKEMCAEQNIPFNLIVGENLAHVYPAFPIHEGSLAINQIANILKQDN